MRKIREMLRLKYEAGLTERQIAASVGVVRSTVQECLRRARQAQISWPLPSALDEAALEARLYPPRSCSEPTTPPPDFAAIHAELARHKGMTRRLAWQEYKATQPDGWQYTQFCEHYRIWLKVQDVVLRQQHAPGAALFVDYAGQTAEVVDRTTGEIKPVKLFVAVLGCSNLTYAEATWGETSADWLSAQTRALTFIGGVTAKIVPDNPKALVTRACRYEPDLHPAYQDFAEHYGVAIVPARVREPRDKAKVETGVQIAERWILARLRNQTFFTLAELNGAIRLLLDELNRRPFQKLPGNRQSRFDELERAALKPLPQQPYEFATWKQAKVHLDYHVEIERHCYSVPYRYIGKTVDVRLSATGVEIFHRSQRIAVHARSRASGSFTTIEAHRPPRHQAVVELSHERLRRHAEAIGPATLAVVLEQVRRRVHPDQALRASLGILRLAKDFSATQLEQACARALELKTFSYRAVRGLIQHPPTDPPAPPPVLTHDNVRGADYFAGGQSC
jgi:transposase